MSNGMALFCKTSPYLNALIYLNYNKLIAMTALFTAQIDGQNDSQP